MQKFIKDLVSAFKKSYKRAYVKQIRLKQQKALQPLLDNFYIDLEKRLLADAQKRETLMRNSMWN